MSTHSNAHANAEKCIFDSQFPGNWFEFGIIFGALQFELFRFKIHLLGSKILKFPEFNLLMIIFSEEYNVAVYITNQMTADPGAGMSFVADPKKPVGGHILAHASATRIMVSRSNLIPPVDLRMFK